MELTCFTNNNKTYQFDEEKHILTIVVVKKATLICFKKVYQSMLISVAAIGEKPAGSPITQPLDVTVTTARSSQEYPVATVGLFGKAVVAYGISEQNKSTLNLIM